MRIDFDWPWEYRRRYNWQPVYEMRQVVYVEDGRRWRRDTRLEIRTRYRQRVIDAGSRRAEVEIDLVSIELLADGRFLGEIRRIPNSLRRLRATIFRNGGVRLDRDVFLVGAPDAGFELISTRYYDRYLPGSYQRSDGFRVGEVDLRRGRVREVRHSRLFDPGGWDRFLPIPLLPRDLDRLVDYGYGSLAEYGHYDHRYHYYGAVRQNDTEIWDDWQRIEPVERRTARESTDPDRGRTNGSYRPPRAAQQGSVSPDGALIRQETDEAPLEDGSNRRIRRETELRRVE